MPRYTLLCPVSRDLLTFGYCAVIVRQETELVALAEYITTLKHDVSVLDYYSGFIDPTKGEMWDAQRPCIARQARICREG